MALHVYDTRTREKRPFETARTGEVDMYVCGITPYSPSHLGHARCYIAFDLIHRWLEASGWTVHYVQNFTDIDDKIINKANEEGIDFLEVANRNIEDYYAAMDALNVLRADHYPRVTEVVPEIVNMVEILIGKGHAYVTDDGVWFDVGSAPEKYGVLTGQSIDAVMAGAGGRVEESGKRDHKDFALWKVAKPGEPAWPSPWGEGRPGWHIECSAMSLKHFGEQFDIHGGGHDLRFPHHEAEIFQSECCTGKEPLVRFWMHNGFVNIDGEKMSKSLGNFWTITDALEKFDPLVLRHALLNAHYRSPIDLSEQLLEDAKRHHSKLIESYGQALVIVEQASKAGMQETPRLPQPEISSNDFLTAKLGRPKNGHLSLHILSNGCSGLIMIASCDMSINRLDFFHKPRSQKEIPIIVHPYIPKKLPTKWPVHYIIISNNCHSNVTGYVNLFHPAPSSVSASSQIA